MSALHVPSQILHYTSTLMTTGRVHTEHSTHSSQLPHWRVYVLSRGSKLHAVILDTIRAGSLTCDVPRYMHASNYQCVGCAPVACSSLTPSHSWTPLPPPPGEVKEPGKLPAFPACFPASLPALPALPAGSMPCLHLPAFLSCSLQGSTSLHPDARNSRGRGGSLGSLHHPVLVPHLASGWADGRVPSHNSGMR
jgi:hypothetical protein